MAKIGHRLKVMPIEIRNLHNGGSMTNVNCSAERIMGIFICNAGWFTDQPFSGDLR